MVLATVSRKRLSSYFDWPLTLFMIMLCLVGLCVLYSAGYDVESQQSLQMKRQAASMGVGLFVYLVCSFMSISFWRRWAYLFYGVGCLLLMLVLSQGIVVGGAERWLDMGQVRIQPSEFMKLAMVLAFARLFSVEEAPRDGYNLPHLVMPLVLVLLPAALIRVQPDLGTAMMHVLIAGSMLLLVGIRKKTLLTFLILGILLVPPAWTLLHDYQRERILNFWSPERDPKDTGYHAIQSKIAVGSGALTGKGFLQGSQTQLRFLPEQTTDFIFSVLAEEWGFVGSVFTLTLYFLLLIHLLQIVSKCTEPFPAFVSFGVCAMLFWQVVINIGMVIGVFPVVGITLPLLSYGGSSIVTIMAGLGIVGGIYRKRYRFTP